MLNTQLFAFFGLFLAATPAIAGEIAMTELGESAETLSAGEVLLHPLFYASSYGITDELQLNMSILEYLGQPNAALEYNLTNSETLAISVNTSFSTDWAAEYTTVGSGATLTLKFDEDNLNFSLAKERMHLREAFSVEPYGSPAIPLSLSYDYRLDDTTILHFGVESDGFQIINKRGSVIFSAHWAHSIKKMRLRLGVDAVASGFPLNTLSPLVRVVATAITSNPDNPDGTSGGSWMPEWPIVPLPHIEMWFSF